MEFNFSPPTSRVSRGLQTFAVVLVWVQRDFFFLKESFLLISRWLTIWLVIVRISEYCTFGIFNVFVH